MVVFQVVICQMVICQVVICQPPCANYSLSVFDPLHQLYLSIHTNLFSVHYDSDLFLTKPIIPSEIIERNHQTEDG